MQRRTFIKLLAAAAVAPALPAMPAPSKRQPRLLARYSDHVLRGIHVYSFDPHVRIEHIHDMLTVDVDSNVYPVADVQYVPYLYRDSTQAGGVITVESGYEVYYDPDGLIPKQTTTLNLGRTMPYKHTEWMWFAPAGLNRGKLV